MRNWSGIANVDVRIARLTFAIAVPLLACAGDPHAAQEARSTPPAVRPPGAPVAVPARGFGRDDRLSGKTGPFGTTWSAALCRLRFGGQR